MKLYLMYQLKCLTSVRYLLVSSSWCQTDIDNFGFILIDSSIPELKVGLHLPDLAGDPRRRPWSLNFRNHSPQGHLDTWKSMQTNLWENVLNSLLKQAIYSPVFSAFQLKLKHTKSALYKDINKKSVLPVILLLYFLV